MNNISFSYYLITDRKACAPRTLLDVVDEACGQGIKAVQLREKDVGGRALYKLAKQLRKVTKQYGTLLFINDRVDIALAVGADGIHCRENSLSPEVIKKLSNDLLIGSSVHSVKRAQKVKSEGADFLLFGPVFYTPSKDSYGQPQGIERLKEVIKSVNIPVFAVGGINMEEAQACLDVGAEGIAGISSIMKSSATKGTVKNWEKILGEL